MRKNEKKVSTAIFINNKKELLLHLRDNKNSIPYPNHWSTLGGGSEEGESPVQTLKREIKEEIDFNIREKNLKFLGIIDDLVGNEVHIFKYKINKPTSELKLNEGQGLRYFDFDTAIKIKLPGPLKNFLIRNKEEILGD